MFKHEGGKTNRVLNVSAAENVKYWVISTILTGVVRRLQQKQIIEVETVPALTRAASTTSAISLLSYWRTIARMFECRWGERARALRTHDAEPLHPADEH